MLATPASPAFLKEALTLPQIETFWKEHFSDHRNQGLGNNNCWKKQSGNEFSFLVKDKSGREHSLEKILQWTVLKKRLTEECLNEKVLS